METLSLLYCKDIKPVGTLNPLTNFFPKKRKYLGRTQEITKERCIDLIIKTNTAFTILENLEFEAFGSYFAQCDVSLLSENTLRRATSIKLDGEKVKM